MAIKNWLLPAVLAAASGLALALAQDPADLRQLAARFQSLYPGTAFSAVRASAVAGLYEVVMGQNVAYTDASGRYFVFGHLYDMQAQVDLTAQGQPAAPGGSRAAFPSQFLGNAIKVVRGDGRRQLVVFSDPNCPYCRQLEQELGRLDNVTVYTFLYPVLGEASKALAIATWCAADRARAWSDWMLAQRRPALQACVTPIRDNLLLAARLGVSGTPTLMAADGRMLPGAASAERIQAWLEAGK